VPALSLATVLYKPSEYATLTGLEIGKLLHLSGVPQDVFHVLVGGGAVGSALLAQPIDGVFFTGSYATGAKIAEAVGPRMIKMQLELGGKDPAYVCQDVDVAAAAASLADGAMYNTGQSCCSVERIYVHENHDAFVAAFVKKCGVQDRRPDHEDTYIRPLTRRSWTCSSGRLARCQGAEACCPAATASPGRATGTRQRCSAKSTTAWRSCARRASARSSASRKSPATRRRSG
jgi:acyl-CoA reductase-like NAD-dependent aldehyde dehydrogenase